MKDYESTFHLGHLFGLFLTDPSQSTLPAIRGYFKGDRFSEQAHRETVLSSSVTLQNFKTLGRSAELLMLFFSSRLCARPH